MRLSGVLTELIIEKFGTSVFLERLSDPFWFHSFSLAIGFDWNSSGTTTATLSALKDYLSSSDAPIKIVGGKGQKISSISTESSLLVKNGFVSDAQKEKVLKSSKVVARVDQNLLQDSYDLYLHFITMDSRGNWSIIQQGMNSKTRLARRYHWIDDSFFEYLDDGRSGIGSNGTEKKVLDLSTKRSANNRDSMIDVIKDNPERYRSLERSVKQKSLFAEERSTVLDLDHPVNWKKLRDIYEYNPVGFPELMMMRGVGKSTIRALSYLGELVYGEKASFVDPLKFSFALGGKDGIPKPVDYADYDKCLEFYTEALSDWKAGRFDTMALVKNLSKAGFDIVSSSRH